MTDPRLGWTTSFDDTWRDLERPGHPARVIRLDRGWSTAARSMAEVVGDAEPLRIRNIGAD
ncbi:MAG: hypothetical protein AAGG08_07410, partial [Actinomycetota bacterium]